MTTKRQASTKRNSRIYTELQTMYTRLTGKAPDVHSEPYQRLMKLARKVIAPVMIEQEKTK